MHRHPEGMSAAERWSVPPIEDCRIGVADWLRAVEANRVRKSIGAENSFAENLKDKEIIIVKLEQVAQTLVERIERHQAAGRTLTLKVKFADYQQITRSHTFTDSINSLDTILTEALALLEIIELEDRSVRLLGLSLSNLG